MGTVGAMKLSFALRTRAVRARWLLEELGLPYTLEPVSPDAAPALEVDGVRLTESLAIALRLAEPVASHRAEFLEWLIFSEATLEAALVRDAAELPALLDRVARRLESSAWIVGDDFSAADVWLASVLHRAHHGGKLANYPALLEYVVRCTSRPASRRAVGL